MGYEGIARTALDAAIEIEAAARKGAADMPCCLRVADAIEGLLDDPAPCAILDLREALRPSDPGIRTVQDMEREVRAEAAVLRAAAGGDADALPRARTTCLALHRTLLSLSRREGLPYWLAA